MAGKQPVKIDINTATKDALVSVSGIGESLAQRIMDNRPYSAVKELIQISGISEIKLAALTPYLKVSAPDAAAKTEKSAASKTPSGGKPFTKVGNTEAFVFLEDRDERQDAFLIIFGGLILGLLILLFRRHSD